MVIRLPDPPEEFQSLTYWLYNQTETSLEDLIKQKDPRQVREYALALITVLNEVGAQQKSTQTFYQV